MSTPATTRSRRNSWPRPASKTLAYYRDASMGAFNMLKEKALALGLPVTLLVDRQGCLVAAMNGPANWSGPDAARLVDAALGRK